MSNVKQDTEAVVGGGAGARQDALWLLEALVPGTAVNNLSVAFRVGAAVDPAALRAALAAVVRRHEALRTVYNSEGARLSVRVTAPGELRPEVTEVATAAAPTAADLEPYVTAPFRISGEPLIRATLLHHPDADVCVVTAHQLVLDAPSRRLLLEELVAEYERVVAEPASAEPNPVEPGYSAPRPSPDSLAYWRARLAGVVTDALDLGCALPDPERPTLSGAIERTELSPGAAAAVRRLSEDLAVSERSVLLAGYCALLDAHGAGPDLVVGLPHDLRQPACPRTIGSHVNVLPLRIPVDPDEHIGDLIRRSHDVSEEAEAHADVAVDAHAPELLRSRSGRLSAMFRLLFDYASAADGLPARFTLAGTPADLVEVENGCARPDLELRVESSADGGLRVRAVYRTEVLTQADVRFLLERYDALLCSFGARPGGTVGALRGWSARDHAVIDAANDSAGPVEPDTVLQALWRRVAATPDAVAVVEDEREVTYRALWFAAQRIRSLIEEAGVEPGGVVAVALPRGAALAASVLGTWLAGAAYLPVDTAHPEERIRYQLSDSGVRLVLGDAELAELAEPGVKLTVLQPPPVDETARGDSTHPPDEPDEPGWTDPESCAYLMYTSGSTGRPKGTLVPHLALANLVLHFVEELRATPQDATLWTTTFAFDISGLELFVPLVSGGRVVAGPDAARSSGRVLGDLLDRHEIRIVQATPTTWRLVLDRVADRLSGRIVLCGGEPVPAWLAGRLVAAGAELHHVYGPTETTIWSTSAVVAQEPTGRLDVGRPIRNTRLLVLDGQGRPLPVGLRGELCIAGSGVAIGYHGRPDLNAERFGVHPEHGRYYRTGDIAAWRPTGVVDLMGRSDRQVKLRGNRIELGEIESTLMAHPHVGGVAVVLVGDPSGDGVLVAWLEPAAALEALELDDIAAHARERLSRAMVPGEFLPMDALPINGSGKIDYPLLERRAAQRRSAGQAVGAAREREGRVSDGPGSGAPGDASTEGSGPVSGDRLLDELVALWSALLRRDDVDADTDFFEHGGHSMLAAIVLQELERISGVSLDLSQMFEQPATPRVLAARARGVAEEAG
ncbi:non-ribosomal peptide synthetase [Streptomyces canus]|uniref:non-ribosomal peptide synthetase n=1 Tax=Streptomyces canus TaxID=58343 RepID=UPI0022568978|nr:amino acid adenylation domain-containing protein [Streptomyces canus]MCX4852224.1 amino acid adenylation domain-containing protein [Streptomyces canus]